MAKTTIRSVLRAFSSASKQYAPPAGQIAAKADYAAALNAEMIKPIQSQSPLARLPTSSLLRSLFLSIFFTRPILFKPGLAVFSTIANSKSNILNPDKNPLLRSTIKPLIYDQFCAGRNVSEIHKTSSNIKALGFSGVVLCYGKEVQLSPDGQPYGYSSNSVSMEAEVSEWKDGNLRTLQMLEAGDWLGMKLTGAGLAITKALLEGGPPPACWVEAMDAICEQARLQNARIWIDAEQQVLQRGIDRWAFDVMRRFNINDRALVYNTVQAYLKTAREKVQHQLDTATKEGWRSAIKLVRGAYISNDQRGLIHDTKEDTDASYNGIVEDLLQGKNFPVFNTTPALTHDLLLAGHNTSTIRAAAQLAADLKAAGKLKVVPEFGQLQGMADDIGCELVQRGEEAVRSHGEEAFVPKVYKCLTWGSIQECMQYLTRRLVENRGAADRMKEGMGGLRSELWRRAGLGRS